MREWNAPERERSDPAIPLYAHGDGVKCWANVRTHERTKGWCLLRLSDRKALSAIQRRHQSFVRHEPDIPPNILPHPRVHTVGWPDCCAPSPGHSIPSFRTSSIGCVKMSGKKRILCKCKKLDIDYEVVYNQSC